MYEGDTPNAERRAAALALDRELLRELLGQEELRELIDPGALEHGRGRPAADLSERTRADSVDALHDVLRRVGDLTLDEARARAAAATTSRPGWSSSRASGARSCCALGGEQRWVAAEDAGLLPRRARRACRRPACRRRSSPTCPTRWSASCAARRARTARSRRAQLRERYGLDLTPVLAGLERAGELVRGELRPGGTQREWCDPEVLRRLRRASLAALREEIEPADQRALARFLPALAGRRPPPAGRRRASTACATLLVPLQGLALPADVWERDVLPRRTGAYSPALAGPAVRGGRGRLGRRGRARAPLRPRGAVLPRGRRRCSARRRGRARAARRARPRARSASACAPGAVLLHRPARRRRRHHRPRSSRRRCGTSCGRAR